MCASLYMHAVQIIMLSMLPMQVPRSVAFTKDNEPDHEEVSLMLTKAQKMKLSCLMQPDRQKGKKKVKQKALIHVCDEDRRCNIGKEEARMREAGTHQDSKRGGHEKVEHGKGNKESMKSCAQESKHDTLDVADKCSCSHTTLINQKLNETPVFRLVPDSLGAVGGWGWKIVIQTAACHSP